MQDCWPNEALQPTGAAILILQSRSLSARPRRLSLALAHLILSQPPSAISKGP